MFGNHRYVFLVGVILAVVIYGYRFYLNWTVVKKQPARQVGKGLFQAVKAEPSIHGFYFFMTWWAATTVTLLVHEWTKVA